jgi:hypothetical protein
LDRVFKFLALAEVESLESGMMPTAIATIWRLSTSPSAKNLKTERETGARSSLAAHPWSSQVRLLCAVISI